jgi:hypothetical protein
MRSRGLKFSSRQRLVFHGLIVILFVSGAVWAWIQHQDNSGQLSQGLRQLKPLLLAVHGLSVVPFVFVLGMLFINHVRRAWAAGHNRKNGLLVIVLMAFLSLSGYVLYYLGNEEWREAASRIHLWLGIAMPLLLLWHIRSGRSLANRK